MGRQPEKRTRSWDLTVAEQRFQMDDLLAESPILNAYLAEELATLYRRVCKQAQVESGLDVFPEVLPFSLNEILTGQE